MEMRRAPHLAGVVVGVLSAMSLTGSVSTTFRHLIAVPRDWVDSYVISMPDTSFAWAFVLALVAIALSARKRVAWWVTAGYLVVFAVTNALYFVPAVAEGYDFTLLNRVNLVIGLVIDAVVLVFLLVTYRQFFTRVRRGSVLLALAVLGGGLIAATGIGWGLVEAFPRDLTPDQRLAYAFNRVVAFAAVDTRTFDGHRSYTPVNGLLGLLGALALMVAAVVLFRSQRLSGLVTPTDERVIRALIAAHGDNNSLAYFSTRRDIAAVFARSGRAVITYRVELGVCLASGDPIGDPRHWPDAIAQFHALCERYGWSPGAMGASERGAQAYIDSGMTALTMGDEAIVEARQYRITGPRMRGVRQAVTRSVRAGVTVRIRRHSELSESELAQVAIRADAWRDTAEERGFAMALSRLGDPADGQCLLVEAVQYADTPAERVVGMLSFVPWGRTGLSLDLMRRDRDAINGVVEAMVSEIATQATDLGVTRISLNFAAFRAVFEQGDAIGAGPVMRGAHGLLVFASRFVQMESLYRSNAKYLPTWEPRFLCAADARLIIRAGLAAVLAEGFVAVPWRRRADAARHVGTESAVPADLDIDELVAAIAAEAAAAVAPPRRPEQVRVRMDKLAALTATGENAYPPADPPSHRISDARDAGLGTPVSVAGRVLRIRDFGSVVFADVRDWTGTVQTVLDTSVAGDDVRRFTSTVDLGDLVRVSGTLGHSRSGELSVLGDGWSMLGKCLHPLPDKWNGLSDPEARVRLRHVDLAVGSDARAMLVARGAAVSALRTTLGAHGYLEVETPVLQQVHGGANATPFETHIEAYDLDLYLRIAPELYLKRLCVGGVERVFEIGRNFRNEGADATHNPEFTSLEAYQAHGDYRTMMELARELVQAAATAAHGTPIALRPTADGGLDRIDISGDWAVRDVHEAVGEAVSLELGDHVVVDPTTDLATLRHLADRVQIAHHPDWDVGQVVLELYEHLVESRTTSPTFYVDFPTSVSPLTREHPDRPGVAQRWDLVAWGMELGTAYSELTDPVEQRARLTAQSERAAGGDVEAMELDEDFLTALEYAMPPTGGLGLGVDRIIMLITGRPIRDTLPFPLVRPR
ncbi:bifunctional lysylphosphatidylglycerol synthetase/lysine--tRNA ligase LysX [Williamsia deligens]|uniref:Lysine--tRNA ligase n=1 Tax=Williamsia deligens TaxID=321325 RepID=A0ABW3G3Y3_9NOCA|nr:bifunctional lysylphosphatidylglycerol synthetase/lysine--tRNA ligase LysX [Williamsia deligens]MCP2193897.1 lysyl-tRNA synthetase, class II [Williamsia deligens]